MKKRILVADDSITIQKVVELTFSEGEFEVMSVGSGAAALQRLEKETPDIALLDVIMPEGNGYDVCTRIKTNPATAWMPVLLLTGTFEPYDEKRARAAGASGHLKKPFESRSLVARVEELLAAHPRPGASFEPARADASGLTQAPAMEAAVQGAAARMVPPAVAPAAPAPAQPARVKAPEISAPTHAAPEAARQPAARSAPADRTMTRGNGGSLSAPVPPEILEKAVREAVAGISEKIVREVAWEVIPDLAEAMIRRRIRELEEEADSRR